MANLRSTDLKVKVANLRPEFMEGGYIQCKHYNVEAEYTFRRSITKGDTICLNDLLFTNDRDYLITNNNQYLKAKQLEGKVIGIYFVPITGKDPRHSWFTALLKDVYDDLHPFNNFETVLVACNILDTDSRAKTDEIPIHCSLPRDPQKLFQDLFSYMPWTAIPFSDVTCRKHLQRSFDVSEKYIFQPKLYIVDQTGMVLQCNSWDILEYYGSLGYPFSDKRLKFLRTEDYLATKQPSLKTLLGSPKRDYVISNNGEKVPIHTFEEKVVALYFYHPDFPDKLTEELKLAYEEFAKIRKIFEVVLVYIYEPYQRQHWRGEKLFWKSEELFWEKFKTMPWLALPFKDTSYKKLKRVFEFQFYDILVPRLVIFGPHGDYIEPFGSHMLIRYGVRAFPFTRKKAVELETKKVKELNLEMLWNSDNVFTRNDGSQVPFSQLFGKRIMFVLESSAADWMSKDSEDLVLYTEFLTRLTERYIQNKGTDYEFEVILISTSMTKSSFYKDLVGDMPWLVSSANELILDLSSSYYWYGISTNELIEFFFPILAFNPDGRVVRKTLYPKFEDVEFPFYAGGLEDEMLSQLITLSMWDYSRFFRYNGRIYT
ncbi:putative nucleoredoxin 1 isoform X2 [Apium graveolens]|uniref:putative nucleoredoxin 1 isoform X2 n=1 Tax=Apium graveolens TaxID=4045 RepID=UPI003D7BC4B0